MNPHSTLLPGQTPARVKAAVAALLALLLVMAGALTAPPAHALLAGASVTANVTVASEEGLTVGIEGVGYGTLTAAYAAVIEKGTEAQLAQGDPSIQAAIVDGAFTGSLTRTAAALDPSKQYEVIVWQTQTFPNDATLYARSDIAVSPAQWDAVFLPAPPAVATSTTLTAAPEGTAQVGATVTLTATVAPAAAGSVEFFDGETSLGVAAVAGSTASIATSTLAQGSHSLTATFTPTDAATHVASTSATVAYSITAAPTEPTPVTPTVSVSKTTVLARGGEVITVTGTGFTPTVPATNGTRPPLAGVFGGSYVVFGKFLDAWQPSAGAPTAARTVITQKWGVAAAQFGGSVNAGNGGFVIAEDGTFSIDIEVSASEANDLRAGNYGIYTYPGSGATHAPFETFTPLAFTQPVPTPVVSVSKTSGLDPAGESITIRGSGFVPSAPATDATRPPVGVGDFGGAYVVFGKWPSLWAPSEGGTRPAAGNLVQRWGVHQAQFGGGVNAGNGGFVIAADGTFEITIPVADSSALEGSYGIYTYAGGGATYAPFETFTPLTFAQPAPTGPQIDVTVTDASAADGATVRVIGSGFGDVTGAYAAIIEKGTEDAVSAGGGYVAFGFWMTPGAIVGGAFDKTLIAPAERLDRAKEYEVIVWQGHTVPDSLTIYARADVPISTAQWDLIAPVDIPRVIVSKTTGLDSQGETITVRGSGFLPSPPATSGTRPPLFGQFTGAYVVFGSFQDDWRPSEGAAGSARKGYDTKWGVHEASVETIGGAARGAIVIQPDGTFETTLTAAEAADALSDGNWGVYTYAGGGAVYAPFETYTPVSFHTVTPPETPPVMQPNPPAPPVAGGSLRWAISSSFSSYVTGPIAHGAISVSGGATRASGVFQFGQRAGSSYDVASGTGNVGYGGSVRFTGHSGALDVTIANPQVRITSPTTGSLYVTSGGAQVNFATLNLAAGARSASGGTVTYTAVPATLTAAGRDQVLGGFSTSLDPVTFTIGSAAAAPSGATGTVAAAPAATTTAVPTTPPATDGIEAAPDQLAALSTGLPATVTASGFQANEQGIQVVIYSTPIVLGTVDADAAGTATWTGSVPATLADGEHTLTFQGSVDRGIRFTLARAAAVTDGCVVAAASLRWGFKESFRSYIEGIAGGGWELTGVAYEYPEYVWTSGSGTADAETRTGLVTYGGSIRFTGHDGALDTTLANARVELAGAVGYLVFDITGTTQAGDTVTASGVRFAEFPLPDLELTAEGLVLDALPATLTEAGAAAFGTYPAGEALDPVSAVLPVGVECGTPVAAPAEEAPVAAAPISEEAAAESEPAPLWPWALGGIAVALAIGAVVWVVVARRRSAVAAASGGDGEGHDAD